jgi:mRNA interferase RelE/StbE
LHEFNIIETASFQKEIKKHDLQRIYQKIKDVVYPQLRQNPHFGVNIKKLKGEFSDYYRYRFGAYRLIYKIDAARVFVALVALKS